MKFACSPVSATLSERIVKACYVEDAPWLALLDMTMLNEKSFSRLVQRHTAQVCWVLDGSALESFGRQGPVLLSLPSRDQVLLRELISLCQSRPALSLLSPRHGVGRLVAVLQWLASIETGDGDAPLYCRFADTRVTSSLLAILHPAQREQLAGALDSWCWPNRLGQELTCHTFDVNTASTTPPDRLFEVNAQQFAQMLMVAEPDMVFQMLLEKMPDVLPQQDRGAIYLRIASMIKAAREHGLEDLPDLFQFVVVGLTTFDEFHASHVLTQLWRERTTNNQRFYDWLAGWPDEVWMAIDSKQIASV